jgi:hypothetical protein
MTRFPVLVHLALLSLVCALASAIGNAQDVSAPAPQAGTIVGTVMDTNSGTIPGATVELEGAAPVDRRTTVTSDSGFFQFTGVNASEPYRLIVTAKGFGDWDLSGITLAPGQYLEVSKITLAVTDTVTVQAASSSEEIATQQVNVETTQRAFGIVPMFYAVYDKNAVPLSPKLKFKLAWRTSIDPFSFGADAFLAGFSQANDSPSYQQGAEGYFKRFGADYANGFSDIMIGGAVLPTVLRQDPRYHFQGTGSTKSRLVHALTGPLICKGDNGHWQPNFSSVGGYLASGAIANTYYPARNRGTAVVFSISLIDLAGTMTADVIQEFLPHRISKASVQ